MALGRIGRFGAALARAGPGTAAGGVRSPPSRPCEGAGFAAGAGESGPFLLGGTAA
ncbi:hypothetical protein GCM10009605_28470 [Nocardiopsis composta]